jgi:hypothetical protein
MLVTLYALFLGFTLNGFRNLIPTLRIFAISGLQRRFELFLLRS